MGSPFCTACGATLAEGTRFCVKCGQPVGQAAPSPSPAPVDPTAANLPPTVQPPVFQQTPYEQPSYEQPRFEQPVVPPPLAVQQTVKKGSSAGIAIGIIGILLLIGATGAWFYMRRGPGVHATSTVQVATTPTAHDAGPPPGAPVQPATPEVIPPNPDLAKPDSSSPPTSSPKAQPKPQPVRSRPADAAPPAPVPRPAARVANPTSGVLHASGEVMQDGEVVFENLPGARLRFIFDHAAWRPTISRQPNGTQTLVMRSLRPGIQRACDVQWEIVP